MKLRLLFEAPLGAMVVDPSIADAASKLRADPRDKHTDSRGMVSYGNNFSMPAYSAPDTKILGNEKVRAELKRVLDKSKYNFNILFLDKMFWDEAEKYEQELKKDSRVSRDFMERPEDDEDGRNYYDPDDKSSRGRFPNSIALVKRALADERAKRFVEAGDIQGLYRHLGYDNRGVYDLEIAGANEAYLNDNLGSSINLVITQSTPDPYTAWMILHQFGEAYGFNSNNREWLRVSNPFKKDNFIRKMFKTSGSNRNDYFVDQLEDIVRFGSENRELLTRLIALAEELIPDYRGENNGCKPIMSEAEFNTWRRLAESGAVYTRIVSSKPEDNLLAHYNVEVIYKLINYIHWGITNLLCMSRGAKINPDDKAEFMAEYLWHTDTNGNHRLRRNPDLIRVKDKQGRALITKYLGEEAEQLVERYYKNIEQRCENVLKKAVGTITFHPNTKIIRV